MKRSAIRELTFRLIYSLEIQKTDDLEEQIELYLQCNDVEDDGAKEYIKDIKRAAVPDGCCSSLAIAVK